MTHYLRISFNFLGYHFHVNDIQNVIRSTAYKYVINIICEIKLVDFDFERYKQAVLVRGQEGISFRKVFSVKVKITHFLAFQSLLIHIHYYMTM